MAKGDAPPRGEVHPSSSQSICLSKCAIALSIELNRLRELLSVRPPQFLFVNNPMMQ